jgi:AcrR family transcriptional regulator
VTSVGVESTESAADRIRESALREVERNGIIGLRIADVAAGANCSVALVYKYFGDRDNLLAVVLGELYERHLIEDVQRIADWVDSVEPSEVTPERIAFLIRPPTDRSVWPRRHSTLQIIAASFELPVLRARLVEVHRDVDARVDALIEQLQGYGFTKGTKPNVLRFVYRAAIFGNIFYEYNEEAGPTEAEWTDVWTRFIKLM